VLTLWGNLHFLDIGASVLNGYLNCIGVGAVAICIANTENTRGSRDVNDDVKECRAWGGVLWICLRNALVLSGKMHQRLGWLATVFLLLVACLRRRHFIIAFTATNISAAVIGIAGVAAF